MKKSYIFFGFFVFFTSFFRLSLVSPNLYFSLFWGAAGVVVFCVNSDLKKVLNDYLYASFIVLMLLLVLALGFDFYQTDLNLQSSFVVRLSMIAYFTFFSSVFCFFFLKEKKSESLLKIIEFSIWLQIALFFAMYFFPGAKVFIYSVFGMADSVNLSLDNQSIRGFGLSTEINYMSPFLMVFLCFFVLERNYFLILLVCLTQVVNSNMAVLAVVLGIAFSPVRLIWKFLVLLVLCALVFYFGESIFPRFYAEFIDAGGMRTIDTLLNDHMVLVGPGHWFDILFGSQQNISSSVVDAKITSDIGWVILYNYGGIIFILLYVIFIYFLSQAAFGCSYVRWLWFFIGLILNTKGLVLSPNGYMFISFLLALTRSQSKKISHLYEV